MTIVAGFFWLLRGFSGPPSVEAHNGSVAIAVPVEGIVVDGDFSDWPEGMTRCPILLLEYGEKLKDAEDFAGDFRIGYNERENALYVAVEVQDESTVIDTATTNPVPWNTQDGCEDLRALTLEASMITGVPLVGTNRVFGGGPGWK
jgi:hypothetical protein